MFVKPSHQNFEKIYQRIYNRKFPAMQGMETVFIRLTNVIVSFYFLVDSETIWIPQTTESEEMATTECKQLDVDKFCGIPAFFQNSKVKSDDMLLLQLHTNWLPFYINGGGEPTMFIFLNGKKDGGFILIEDM